MSVDTSHSASVQKSNQDNPVTAVPQKVLQISNPQSRIKTSGLRTILSSAARAEETCTLSKPIKCDQPGCYCEFKRPDSLTRHKRQKHPDCHLSGKWESEQPSKQIENSSNDRKTRSKSPERKVNNVIVPVKRNTAKSPVVETDSAKGAQEKTKCNMVISTAGKETEEKEAMLTSKEFKCTQPGCGKEYSTSRSLSGHVTKYHPNVQRGERNRKSLEMDEEALVAKSIEPVKKNTAKSLGSEKDRAKGAQEKLKDKIVIKMKDNMVISIAGTEAEEKEILTSKEYKCTEPGCGKEYGTSRSLSGHMAKFHPNVQKGERKKMALDVDEEAMMAHAEETMAQWDALQAEKTPGKNSATDAEPSLSREMSKRGKRKLSLPPPQTIEESPPQKKPKTLVTQICTLCHARRKKCERLGGPNDPCKFCVEKNLECIPRLKKDLDVEKPTQSFFSEDKDPTKAYMEKVVGKKWRVFGLQSKRGQGINGKIGYCRGVTFPVSKAVALGGAETFLHVAIEGIPTMQYKCVNLELVDEGN